VGCSGLSLGRRRVNVRQEVWSVGARVGVVWRRVKLGLTQVRAGRSQGCERQASSRFQGRCAFAGLRGCAALAVEVQGWQTRVVWCWFRVNVGRGVTRSTRMWARGARIAAALVWGQIYEQRLNLRRS